MSRFFFADILIQISPLLLKTPKPSQQILPVPTLSLFIISSSQHPKD